MQGFKLGNRLSAIALLMALSMSTVGARDQAGASGPQRIVDIPGIGLDTQIAPIKSREQLREYLIAHPGQDNPLFPLSDRAKKHFLDSLVFTERGLASFDAGSLERNLTVSQIYHVLSMFGLQRMAHTFNGARVETEADAAVIALGKKQDVGAEAMPCPAIYHYKCSPPATCTGSSLNYCVTCNCHIP